jgi:hypothetical protein
MPSTASQKVQQVPYERFKLDLVQLALDLEKIRVVRPLADTQWSRGQFLLLVGIHFRSLFSR